MTAAIPEKREQTLRNPRPHAIPLYVRKVAELEAELEEMEE